MAHGRPHPRLELSDKYINAIKFAHEYHNGQVTEASHTPYFAHLQATASIVLKHHGTETEAISALLVDTLKQTDDPKTLLQTIQDTFGKEVANIVRSLNDPFDDISRTWREQRVRYIARLNDITESSKQVAAANILDTLREMRIHYEKVGDVLWSNFKIMPDQILWFYDSVADIFSQRGPHTISQEINAELNRLKQLSQNN